MTEDNLAKTKEWIKNSGIEIVTGVHVKETPFTGLGLEFVNSENIRDKEEFLRSHAEDETKLEPQESHSLELEPSQSKETPATNVQDNEDRGSDEDEEGDEYDEELSDADSYQGEDASVFDDEYSDSDYEDEKIVMLIPSHLILSPDRIRDLAEKNSALSSWLDSEDLSDKDCLHLGLLYLWLVDTQNAWKGYFEFLPKEINLPFSYSQHQMEGACFSTLSLHHTALIKRNEIMQKYQKFVDRKLTGFMPTFQEWLVPHLWIASRGLTHPLTGQTCLVPVIDLCNHSSKGSNCRYDADDEGNFELSLTTPADRLEHDELFLNYGDRSSTEFFFNYGFIPQDRNSDDFDEIFRVFDPRNPEIRRVLENKNASVPYDDFLRFFQSTESQQILRLIRFPKMVEPDEAKRYRFHNNFVMALASEKSLERKDSEDQAWYLNNKRLVPSQVFEIVRDSHDNSIILKARELVARLCDYFESQINLNSENEDPEIHNLANIEASIYNSYAKNTRKVIAESKREDN